MSFGRYCFFYIAAASVALPHFTFGRLSFTILLAPFLRFAAPCPCVFCAALTFYSFYAQFPAHVSSPNKSRCP